MTNATTLQATPKDQGQRLDRFLSVALPQFSRTRLQALIDASCVLVNQKAAASSYRVKAGDSVEIAVPDAAPLAVLPEPIPLEFLYQDSDIAVINKPAGLVVHPLPGTVTGTLVNALLYHCRDLSGINGTLRPGIAHRLDKDTSGCMVIAKNDQAHRGLAAQFKDRTVEKHYYALAWGVFQAPEGEVATTIGRDSKDRTLMSTRAVRGRDAVSIYKVLEQFPCAAAVDVRIVTGRTHQVRVHLAYLKHPVVGDRPYGGHERVVGQLRAEYQARARHCLKLIDRQALHAWKIAFQHPVSGVEVRCEAPLPPDIVRVVEFLRKIK